MRIKEQVENVRQAGERRAATRHRYGREASRAEEVPAQPGVNRFSARDGESDDAEPRHHRPPNCGGSIQTERFCNEEFDERAARIWMASRYLPKATRRHCSECAQPPLRVAQAPESAATGTRSVICADRCSKRLGTILHQISVRESRKFHPLTHQPWAVEKRLPSLQGLTRQSMQSSDGRGKEPALILPRHGIRCRRPSIANPVPPRV